MSCFNRQGEVKADDAKYTGTEPTWDDVSSLTDKEVTDRLSTRASKRSLSGPSPTKSSWIAPLQLKKISINQSIRL